MNKMIKINRNELEECSFYEKFENSSVRCVLCPHNCIIKEGSAGVCNTRINIKGKLYSLTYGKPASISVDPIEKKPLFNFHAGEQILSVGTIGCNLKCKFCQNYDISQAKAIDFVEKIEFVSPEEIIEITKQKNLKLIAFTYNEPTVFYEYMIDIAKLAKQNKIECIIVSNGFINPGPLKKLCKYISAANIDLKSFNKDFYKKICSAKLEPVLESLKILKKNNVHIEVTNLIIKGKNDSTEDIEKIAIWIKENLSEDTILHLSRAFPMYKMQDIIPTPISTLQRAKEICEKHLDFVYLGNI
jgi:pyruvate formate lyase activating enzyme